LTQETFNPNLSHDIKQLRRILGPGSKDLDFFEEALQWPHKPQATLDAEWDFLCSEYAKLTGSSKNYDGVEVPSMSDLCYYIGDWALKYADMGTNIPTCTGSPPNCHPYWARNQVLLHADNGKICPMIFKQELEDELFYMIHYGYKETDEDRIFKELTKAEEVVRWLFFAGDEWIPVMMEYILEDYEKRLRRGLIQEQATPFSDLLYDMVKGKDVSRVSMEEHLALIKDFVKQCEKVKHREFSWIRHKSTLYNKLPTTSPPKPKKILSKHDTGFVQRSSLYGVIFVFGICVVLLAATYPRYVFLK